MIVTEGNPLEDLRYLRHVRMVVARGNMIRDPKVKINETVRAELDKFINLTMYSCTNRANGVPVSISGRFVRSHHRNL